MADTPARVAARQPRRLGPLFEAPVALAVVSVALAAGAGPATPPGPVPAARDLHGDPLPPGALARLGTIRHRPASSELAVTPDGKTVVTCSYSGRVLRFYDAATGRLRRTRRLPVPAWGQSVLSPDGRFVACRETYGLSGMTVWETAGGRQVHAFAGGFDDSIDAASFSADGRMLAVVNGAKTCRLLNLETGKVHEVTTLKEWPTRLTLSPDGRRLLVGALDCSHRCLETGAGKELWRGPLYAAPRVSFSADGDLIALVGGPSKPSLVLLDAATGKPLGPDKLPPVEGVWDCAAAGDTLALLLPKGVLLWDRKTGKGRALEGAGIRDGTQRLVLAPDGKTVFALGPLLHGWDVASGKPLYAATRRLGHTRPVMAVAYSPDGSRVASAAHEGTVTVRVWDAASSRLLHTLPGHGNGWDAFLCFTPDGKQLMAAGSDGRVRVWDVGTGKEVRRWEVRAPGSKEHYLRAEDFHLADDGRTLVTTALVPSNGPLNGRAGTVAVWDTATGKHLLSRPDVKPLYGAAVSPDGRRAVLQGGVVYDLAAAAPRRTLRVDDARLGFNDSLPFTFSPDGGLVAGPLSTYRERERVTKVRLVGLQVWEVATGRPLVRVKLDEEFEDGCRFAFTPDGRRLLTIGRETIRLWDVLSGREALRRAVPNDVLAWSGTPFAFRPDGLALATGHPDTTVLVWDLSDDRRARPAPLTDEERDDLWADLAADDAARGYAAALELAARPGQAASLARDRVRPASPVAGAAVRRWIADLDSRDFQTRRKAERCLAERGEQVEATLREALPRAASLEVRRRIEALLELLRAPHGDELRGLRAVLLLKRLDNPEARKVLEDMAGGDPKARLSQEARAALRPWTEAR